MALKFFIAQIESVTFPGNEYNIKTSPIVFLLELFACYLTANLLFGGHLCSYFRKIIFASHDQSDVDGWVESKHAIYFIQCLLRLRTFCKEIIAFKPLLWKIFARIK